MPEEEEGDMRTVQETSSASRGQPQPQPQPQPQEVDFKQTSLTLLAGFYTKFQIFERPSLS